jgi:uncharacterized protein (DUF433 family)
MIAFPDATPVPLHTDKHGVIRVGGTRVPLETVIDAFQRGETPEQIIFSFPILKLADVYAVIAYYLQHRDEIGAYIRQAEEEGDRIRREIETRQPDTVGIRARLLARREEQKK